VGSGAFWAHGESATGGLRARGEAVGQGRALGKSRLGALGKSRLGAVMAVFRELA
jgi:hypothetical protein